MWSVAFFVLRASSNYITVHRNHIYKSRICLSYYVMNNILTPRIE